MERQKQQKCEVLVPQDKMNPKLVKMVRDQVENDTI